MNTFAAKKEERFLTVIKSGLKRMQPLKKIHLSITFTELQKSTIFKGCTEPGM